MISAEKLSKLQSVNSMLDKKYGEKGSASRAEFDAKAQAWYYAEMPCEEHKKTSRPTKDGLHFSLLPMTID